MTDTFDLAAIAQSRWKRAVDLLIREVVRRRRSRQEDLENARAQRRLKNLRRILRKALSEYTRLQISKQASLDERRSPYRSHRE